MQVTKTPKTAPVVSDPNTRYQGFPDTWLNNELYKQEFFSKPQILALSIEFLFLVFVDGCVDKLNTACAYVTKPDITINHRVHW